MNYKLDELMTALRLQVNQLDKTLNYGGPSEICGALDAVDYATEEIRNLVSEKPAINPKAER